MLQRLLRRVNRLMVLHVHHGHQQQLRFTMLLVVIQTVILSVKQDIHGMVRRVHRVVVRPVEMHSKNEQKLVMMEIQLVMMDVVLVVHLKH